MTPQDTLDEILTAGEPPVSRQSADLDAAIRRMSHQAQRHVHPRRRLSRPLVAGLTAVLVIGAGASAAAAATWQWHPWAQNPDASFTATMPSGAVCEYRVGGVDGASANAVRTFLSDTDTDILAMADIDREIARARADGQTIYDENGQLQPAGPGTERYNADFEYQSALGLAVKRLITDHLREQGLPVPFSFDMQADCGGS